MSPVEQLRAAEVRIRETVAQAQLGATGWYTPAEIGAHPFDRRLIALMSPPVALAVADWLAEEILCGPRMAVIAAQQGLRAANDGFSSKALAVADAVLGGES